MDTSGVKVYSLFSTFDIDLFKTGKHFRLYEKMGAHPMNIDGEEGVYFAVYAPNAEHLWVVGDFNHWDGKHHKLYSRWDGSGIWEGFIPGVQEGMIYKYKIQPYNNGRIRMKADPYAFKAEKPPMTSSEVATLDYQWHDATWLQFRPSTHPESTAWSVYEVHLGSWMRDKTSGESLTYREIALPLTQYVQKLGFTHVEFLPLSHFPYEPSWGYQVTGYYAASSRYGKPQDLMYLIDTLHQAGIGVIMDWVPAHFPSDDFALATFDGSCVYEHPDRRKGFHPDWNTLIFNYGRPEVRSFLISNAFFWLDKYHIDGLRVDAVSSMIFLDYSRKEGEWEPNHYGGRENLDAISFVQEFNSAVYGHFPGVQTIAEESTSYAMVSRPVYSGGLGFGMKWMMGWMHDTLNYFKREFIYRKYHQNDITFSIVYAFAENFMLSLSHDEVVHGKSALIGKMSGDEWQKFANLRTLYGYMFTHPGTKLLFMGDEIGQYSEWNFTWELDWDILEHRPHLGLQTTVKDLNYLYKTEKALHAYNFHPDGFEWLNASDRENAIIIYKRKGVSSHEHLIIIVNLNVTPHTSYKVGIPTLDTYDIIFNSDDPQYYGSGFSDQKTLSPKKETWYGRPYHIEVDIPPLSTLILKPHLKPKSNTKLTNVKKSGAKKKHK